MEEEIGAESVVGVDVDFAGSDGANHGGEALAHVGTTGFGEGDAEDVFRGGVGVFEDVSYLGREELGFAGARAGEDKQRAVQIFCGGLLSRV